MWCRLEIRAEKRGLFRDLGRARCGHSAGHPAAPEGSHSTACELGKTDPAYRLIIAVSAFTASGKVLGFAPFIWAICRRSAFSSVTMTLAVRFADVEGNMKSMLTFHAGASHWFMSNPENRNEPETSVQNNYIWIELLCIGYANVLWASQIINLESFEDC